MEGDRSVGRKKNFSLWRKNETCLELLKDFLSPQGQKVKLKSKQENNDSEKHVLVIKFGTLGASGA